MCRPTILRRFHTFDIAKRHIDEEKVWMKTIDARQTLAKIQNSPEQRNAVSSLTMQNYILQKCKGVDISDAGVRVVSSLMTFPLTLSYGLNKLFHSYDNCKVLIVGARSESSLPLAWWKECLYSTNIDMLSLLMVGPGLQVGKSLFNDDATKNCAMWEDKPNQKHYSLKIVNKASDVTHYSSMLHQHDRYMELLRWADVFVLFNPGYGSDVLKESWDPTIRLLLETRKPVICTAHGSTDLSRDLTQLNKISLEEDVQELGESIEMLIHPHENPFRSLKLTIDEKEIDGAKIVTTNHSIYAFMSK